MSLDLFVRSWVPRFNLLIENKDDLARLMVLEQGKPLAEAVGEVISTFHSLHIESTHSRVVRLAIFRLCVCKR